MRGERAHDRYVSGVAAKKATTTIPIVMSSADRIGAGLVASLGRPADDRTAAANPPALPPA
jgi:ABC-type uncharacterized transport system substrate-binding protein